MRLWELHCAEGHHFGWDAAHDFVIRADTEADARAIASKECGDGTPQDWLDEDKTTCDELLCDDEAGVIVRSFVSG